MGKRPGTYPEYANGCNFCTNTLAYAKFGNGFVQHVYFLTNLKYANKLPRHMSRGYIRTCLLWMEDRQKGERSDTVCLINLPQKAQIQRYTRACTRVNILVLVD